MIIWTQWKSYSLTSQKGIVITISNDAYKIKSVNVKDSYNEVNSLNIIKTSLESILLKVLERNCLSFVKKLEINFIEYNCLIHFHYKKLLHDIFKKVI